MKRLTLNKAWTLCLKQWKWIIQQRKDGSKLSIEELKKMWLKLYEFPYMSNNCFFCEYDMVGKGSCESCPAVRVEESFHCVNVNHSFRRKPEKFYKKLLRLKRKYEAKRKG